MPGAGDLAADEFDAVLDSPETDFPLFAPPAEPVSDTKYAIGLHAAPLVRDGGTLQIGIGQSGNKGLRRYGRCVRSCRQSFIKLSQQFTELCFRI